MAELFQEALNKPQVRGTECFANVSKEQMQPRGVLLKVNNEDFKAKFNSLLTYLECLSLLDQI